MICFLLSLDFLIFIFLINKKYGIIYIMIRKIKIAVYIMYVLVTSLFFVNTVSANTSQAMYRLYNPNSGEHFYTSSFFEAKSIITAGWQYEHIGWNAPSSGDPVYRLYNPNAGDHHFTLNSNEKVMLVNQGWRDEGISWYSDAKKSVKLYRAYNPNAKSGSHNYTTFYDEQTSLIKVGWRDEGLAWYGTNITPLDNKDSILKELSDGVVGLNKVRFDKVGSEKRSNWLYQTIKWSIPLAADGHLYPSVMTAQAILESSWGESGLSVKANNLFGIKKGNWSGEVYQAVTAEAAHKNGKYTGYRTQAEANAGGKAQVLDLKKGQYYWIITPFRKYSSQQDSLANYVSVLSQSGYADVRRTQAKDYKSSAKALVDEVGWKYATDPKYAQSIINVIETYNLQALD